ncbi:MAG: HD domain-containing phosphohydrolase [Tepidisphaeraceae bacterium]
MLILPLNDAKAGMKLAAPVLHPETPDQELLRRGFVLEDRILRRLADMGIDSVYVDYPGLDDLDRHLAANLSPARQAVYSQIKKTISAVQRQTRAEVTYTDYYAGTRELITTLLSQGQHPVFIDQMSRLGTDAVGHATSVAHLSLLLGLKLERYLIDERSRLSAQHAREVVNLGVAGMLHDLGKCKLPERLQQHNAVDIPEDPAKRTEWESHARVGYDMIHNGIEPSAASAILHHHQHYDGSGFPSIKHKDDCVAAMEGKRIHVFSRIVMVADLYDRLATAKSHVVRRSNLEVLHLIRTKYAGWCDPVVLAALEAITPPFPPGSRIGLSDGSMAVVVDVHPDRPYAPKIKRLIGEEMALESYAIDLSTDGELRIETVGGTPVTGMMPAMV